MGDEAEYALAASAGIGPITLPKALRAPNVGEDEFDNAYSDAAQYGRINFWDAYFVDESEPFEWYFDYATFRETINDNVARDAKVLLAGTGNSHMPEDMVEDGYINVCAADISRVVISQLKIRCKEYPEVSFFQGTMCDTNLPEESVDAIIDKGLLDSIICGQMGATDVKVYMIEIERLLSSEGVFILVSHGNPEERLHFLEQYDIDEPNYTPWQVEIQALSKPVAFEDENLDQEDPDSLYFIYICKKQQDMVMKKLIKENKVKAELKKKKPRKVQAPAL